MQPSLGGSTSSRHAIPYSLQLVTDLASPCSSRVDRDATSPAGSGADLSAPGLARPRALITIDHIIAEYGIAALPGSDHRELFRTYLPLPPTIFWKLIQVS